MLGIKINLLSSLLPPIIFFVSMSDSVHLINAIYKSKKEKFEDKLKDAVSIVWVPTLLTSVTTAIGFLSLLVINTEPIQILGLFAACGIMIAFIITFTFGLVGTTFISLKSEQSTFQVPSRLLTYLLRNRIKIILVGILILAVLLPGISKLKVDAYLLDDLPNSSSIKQSFEYSDLFLEGSKPYEVRLDAKNGLSIWDTSVMREINKIEKYLVNSISFAYEKSQS
jgi:predicted RND superfamily exporter protein